MNFPEILGFTIISPIPPFISFRSPLQDGYESSESQQVQAPGPLGLGKRFSSTFLGSSQQEMGILYDLI
jgi:hypothetical protein